MIDWNIRIGDLLVVSGLAGTFILYAFRSGRFAQSILNMQKEIVELKDVAKTLISIATTQAVMTNRLDTAAERLNMMDKKIEDLRHGNGFVQGSRGVDKTY